MAETFVSARGLSVLQGGTGGRLAVLLHGLGATNAVWQPMIAIAARHWPGRWIAPDLRGHGRSLKSGPYGYASLATDIAALIADEPGNNVTLVGHSMGGVVAALVGTGWYGPHVRNVAAFGVKLTWTDDETAKAQELGKRPAKAFATRAEAIDRFLKLSGLIGLVDPASDTALSGVAETNGQWQVAMDPRSFASVGPSIEMLMRLCAAPLRLAAGADDPMVSLADMQAIDAQTVTFAGAGHNAHWQQPAALWDFVNASAEQE